jgi:hypothetical protein
MEAEMTATFATAEAKARLSEFVHPIMRAFGGWAGRTDLDELVEEIYADREATSGREVAL